MNAIFDCDQALAGAATARYGELGGAPPAVFDLMLKFATSEDVRCTRKKDCRTATEEFANTRPSMQWRELISLARVSASEYGTPGPGYREACECFGVDA